MLERMEEDLRRLRNAEASNAATRFEVILARRTAASARDPRVRLEQRRRCLQARVERLRAELGRRERDSSCASRSGGVWTRRSGGAGARGEVDRNSGSGRGGAASRADDDPCADLRVRAEASESPGRQGDPHDGLASRRTSCTCTTLEASGSASTCRSPTRRTCAGPAVRGRGRGAARSVFEGEVLRPPTRRTFRRTRCRFKVRVIDPDPILGPRCSRA